MYIRGEDGKYELGKVWPYLPGIYGEDLVQDDSDNQWNTNVGIFHSNVVFPDFFKPETYDWWKYEILHFYSNYTGTGEGLKFDGIWIDMNEPASFTAGRPGPDGFNQGMLGCPNDENGFNHPPYIPRAIREGQWEGVSVRGRHAAK